MKQITCNNIKTENDGFQAPESKHQLKQTMPVPTKWKEDRKLNNQTSETKRIKPTVRFDNLISERLATEKVDKNQESGLLVRLDPLAAATSR